MFRLIEKKDYDKGIFNLYNQLSPTPSISREDFNKILDSYDNNHNTYVMEHGEKIVAAASFIIETKILRGGGKVLHIEDVVVSESCRGKGVGKAIVSLLIEIARTNKCYKVILDCSNEYVGFYEKLNFTRKGNMMAIYF